MRTLSKQALGHRIKAIRQKLGLSMAEFGRLLDPPASKGAVSNWENDYNYPNNERLKRIAELGGITVDDLLYASTIESHITEIVTSDEKFDLNKEENRKALQDTISTFEDVNLDINEIDFQDVLLVNLDYYNHDDGSFRIHDKDTYLEWLNLRLKAFSLSDDEIELIVENEIKNRSEWGKKMAEKHNLKQSTLEQMIKQRKQIFNGLKESTKQTINKINNK